ncbi:hypothetical protein DM01DRAFT_73888 [Hesseltinella vesiculosa]|uniref:Uncharacterized protein n=1 Tax=Hesseltinella vesiculosa TaxID=101127 RepID=A0A1X2GGT6_9FUNG|nr:hypothetical protein DM01DRAFT_73888 [Hesseltinella vesiculosa]
MDSFQETSFTCFSVNRPKDQSLEYRERPVGRKPTYWMQACQVRRTPISASASDLRKKERGGVFFLRSGFPTKKIYLPTALDQKNIFPPFLKSNGTLRRNCRMPRTTARPRRSWTMFYGYHSSMANIQTRGSMGKFSINNRNTKRCCLIGRW